MTPARRVTIGRILCLSLTSALLAAPMANAQEGFTFVDDYSQAAQAQAPSSQLPTLGSPSPTLGGDRSNGFPPGAPVFGRTVIDPRLAPASYRDTVSRAVRRPTPKPVAKTEEKPRSTFGGRLSRLGLSSWFSKTESDEAAVESSTPPNADFVAQAAYRSSNALPRQRRTPVSRREGAARIRTSNGQAPSRSFVGQRRGSQPSPVAQSAPKPAAPKRNPVPQRVVASRGAGTPTPLTSTNRPAPLPAPLPRALSAAPLSVPRSKKRTPVGLSALARLEASAAVAPTAVNPAVSKPTGVNPTVVAAKPDTDQAESDDDVVFVDDTSAIAQSLPPAPERQNQVEEAEEAKDDSPVLDDSPVFVSDDSSTASGSVVVDEPDESPVFLSDNSAEKAVDVVEKTIDQPEVAAPEVVAPEVVAPEVVAIDEQLQDVGPELIEAPVVEAKPLAPAPVIVAHRLPKAAVNNHTAKPINPPVAVKNDAKPSKRAIEILAKAREAAAAAGTQEEFSRVIQQCRHVLAIDRSDAVVGYAHELGAWALNKRGEQHADAGELVEAMADFNESLRLDDGRWRARHNRGVLSAQAGRFAEAFEDFNEVIEQNPKFAKAYSNRASLYVQAGDFEAALHDYQQAISVDPDLAVAHKGRGRVCHMLGRMDEALQHFDAAVLLAPNDAPIASSRADLLVDSGRYNEAAIGYSQAIELDPELAVAHRNLAWFEATCPDKRFRDGRSAVTHATKALALTGDKDELSLDTLAAAHAAAGNFPLAVSYMRRAIEASSDTDTSAYTQRLQLYESGQLFLSKPVPAVQQAGFEQR